MKIDLVIRSLNTGGAERQIIELAAGLQREGKEIRLFTFYGGGELRDEALARGVTPISLGKRSRWDLLLPALRLLRFVRRDRPDVLYGWMPAENLLCTVIAFFLKPRPFLVWAIQAGFMNLDAEDHFTRMLYRLEARMAHRADLIISNSEAGSAMAITRGFPPDRIVVVPNGVDVQRFVHRPAGRSRLRRELGISREAIVVGIVARLDPIKDHPTLLRAFQIVQEQNPDAHLVIVGEGSERWTSVLRGLAHELELMNIHWLGTRRDLPDIYSALDLAVLSSLGEGLSNAVLEALACGTPVVSTDVGDSARAIGEAGAVVPVGDHLAMAAAILERIRRGSPDLHEIDRVRSQYRGDDLAPRTLGVMQDGRRVPSMPTR